jgi:hypothetical protein
MIAWRTLLILGWLVLGLAFGPGASLAVTPYDDVLPGPSRSLPRGAGAGHKGPASISSFLFYCHCLTGV